VADWGGDDEVEEEVSTEDVFAGMLQDAREKIRQEKSNTRSPFIPPPFPF
jgi:hypothetical protein